jgi:hypothetical protein
MNRLRIILFAAIVVISSTTFALGGEIQGPGKSDPPPPPPTSALTTDSTSIGMTERTSTEEIQIVLSDATAMIMQILLTIF